MAYRGKSIGHVERAVDRYQVDAPEFVGWEADHQDAKRTLDAGDETAPMSDPVTTSIWGKTIEPVDHSVEYETILAAPVVVYERVPAPGSSVSTSDRSEANSHPNVQTGDNEGTTTVELVPPRSSASAIGFATSAEPPNTSDRKSLQSVRAESPLGDEEPVCVRPGMETGFNQMCPNSLRGVFCKYTKKGRACGREAAHVSCYDFIHTETKALTHVQPRDMPQHDPNRPRTVQTCMAWLTRNNCDAGAQCHFAHDSGEERKLMASDSMIAQHKLDARDY